MSFADDVRLHCIKNYITPARKANKEKVIIRVGDIHKEMNYKNRMPLVCSSLGTQKFENIANVEKLNVTGPLNGANTELHFKILY